MNPKPVFRASTDNADDSVNPSSVFSIFQVFEELTKIADRVALYGNTVLLEKKTFSVLKKWEKAVRNCTDIQIVERLFVANTIPFMFSPIYGHISFNILINQVKSNYLNNLC